MKNILDWGEPSLERHADGQAELTVLLGADWHDAGAGGFAVPSPYLRYSRCVSKVQSLLFRFSEALAPVKQLRSPALPSSASVRWGMGNTIQPFKASNPRCLNTM